MHIIETNLKFKSSPVPRQATNRIVVHHTAGAVGQTAQAIHAQHLSQGWLGCGYNIVQQADGKWYVGRGIDREGAHATGFNRNAIGISLTGNFETHALPANRWRSLVEMCAYLCQKYNLDYTDVVGHRELPGAATLCPGKNINMGNLRRAVHDELASTETSLYRVIVDGRQVGAYKQPLSAVTEALEGAAKITIEKV